MRPYVLAGALALVCAATAAAETPVNVLPELINPQIVGTPPSPRFPAAARKAHIDSGAATVACRVSVTGTLSDCAIVSETQPGLGFGPAALDAASRARLVPFTQGGQPAEARATLPFGFRNQSQNDLRFEPADVPWAAAPDPRDVEDAYPRGAAGSADVTLDCKVRANGRLQSCRTLGETPAGKGFAEAAQRLSTRFQVAMDQVDPTVQDILYVRVPIHFAGPGDPAPGVIGDPVWTRAPVATVLQESFPGKAADAGLSTGRAVLDCVADPEGAMTGCKVVDETPPGMDFGPAALRVAAVMSVALWSADGTPTQERHVKFALRLNRQEGAGGGAR